MCMKVPIKGMLCCAGSCQGFFRAGGTASWSTRLAGPHELAAALGNVKDFPCTLALTSMKAIMCSVDWKKLEECSVAWAARVLARHSAASGAASDGTLPGAPAQGCAPGLPPTDAWAGEAWPGLADLIVKLVLRSAYMR